MMFVVVTRVYGWVGCVMLCSFGWRWFGNSPASGLVGCCLRVGLDEFLWVVVSLRLVLVVMCLGLLVILGVVCVVFVPIF